jgi:hypothetical protein
VHKWFAVCPAHCSADLSSPNTATDHLGRHSTPPTN